MDRRDFLNELIGLGGLVVLAGPEEALAAGWGPHDGERAAPDPARLIPHTESARAIGREYLRRLSPQEADYQRLREDLLASLGESTAQVAAPRAAQLKQRLRDRVREDFRVGHTVELDGWVLSLTELRLSALVALS